jgi:hypothetical protein
MPESTHIENATSISILVAAGTIPACDF